MTRQDESKRKRFSPASSDLTVGFSSAQTAKYDGSFWNLMQLGFEKLAGSERGDKTNRSLCASHPGPRGEALVLSQSTKIVRSEFEWRARQSAVRSGCQPDRNGLNFWLDLLRQESPRYKSWEGKRIGRQFEVNPEGAAQVVLKERSEDSGTIEFVCRASAEYCEKCEIEEMEQRARRETAPKSKTLAGAPHNSLNGLIADAKRRYPEAASNIELMCKRLDFLNVPLPRSSKLKGKKNWHEAWGDLVTRNLIKKMISHVKVRVSKSPN
jgi:hypothetical protein